MINIGLIIAFLVVALVGHVATKFSEESPKTVIGFSMALLLMVFLVAMGDVYERGQWDGYERGQWDYLHGDIKFEKHILKTVDSQGNVIDMDSTFVRIE